MPQKKPGPLKKNSCRLAGLVKLLCVIFMKFMGGGTYI